MKPRQSGRSDAENGVVRYVDVDYRRIAAASFTPAEQSAIDRINLKVGACDSLATLLEFVAHVLHGVSACDRFSLAFTEEGGRRLRSYYTYAFYEPLHLNTGYTEVLSRSTLETVLKRGVPRIITDLNRYLAHHRYSNSTRLLVGEGVRSSLTCPVVVDGRVIGVLFRSSRTPNAYDDRQAVLQAAIAERLCQAIDKTYRIEQLSEANRAYNEMLAFVTHELRAPLASMLTDANLLLDGYLGALTPQQLDRIRRLHAKGQQLMSLIHDYLELARLEGGQLPFEPRPGLDLVFDVLRAAIEIVAPDADMRHMRFERDLPYTLTPVELDPKLIKIALVNLLSNAVKYGRDGGEVRLAVRQEPSSLRITVWNEGQGFTPEERTRLFRRFSRLQRSDAQARSSSGVGLYTTWRIVQLHGGRIQARSEPGRWAEFSFELPQPIGAELPTLEDE